MAEDCLHTAGWAGGWVTIFHGRWWCLACGEMVEINSTWDPRPQFWPHLELGEN